MNCPNCGHSYANGAAFCPICGLPASSHTTAAMDNAATAKRSIPAEEPMHPRIDGFTVGQAPIAAPWNREWLPYDEHPLSTDKRVAMAGERFASSPSVPTRWAYISLGLMAAALVITFVALAVALHGTVSAGGQPPMQPIATPIVATATNTDTPTDIATATLYPTVVVPPTATFATQPTATTAPTATATTIPITITVVTTAVPTIKPTQTVNPKPTVVPTSTVKPTATATK